MKFNPIIHVLLLACLGALFNFSAIAAVSEIATIKTPAGLSSFSISQTGRIGVGITPDAKLNVWNLPDGRLLRTIGLVSTNFYYPTLSADGRLCLSSSSSREVVVWDTATGETVFKLQLALPLSTATFSRDNLSLAVSVLNGPILMYNLADKTKLFELPKLMGVQNSMFSPDNKLFASVDSDTQIRIYDAPTGKLLASNADFLGEFFALDFSPDGKQLVVGGMDKTAVFLDTATGEVTKKLNKQKEPVGAIGVSGDSKWVSTVLFNNANGALAAPVLIWDAVSGRKKSEWLPPSGIVS